MENLPFLWLRSGQAVGRSILAVNRWYMLGENTRYIFGESARCNLGENYWYIVGRKLTLVPTLRSGAGEGDLPSDHNLGSGFLITHLFDC